MGQISIERLFGSLRPYLQGVLEISVHVSPSVSKGFWPRVKNLWAVRSITADVFHIVGDTHYLALALLGRKGILTIHDCSALYRLAFFRRELMRLLWFVLPMLACRVVTVISNTTKVELQYWVPWLADRVVVVPNCVGPEFHRQDKEFSASAPIALQVGTGWNKNVELVASALSGTGCVLEIVGGLTPAQRHHLAETGITFRELGRLSDQEIVDAYNRCDFLIFASTYEGFGLPILEAQATGRPVITSNRSAMPEAAGDGALFVDPESVESIRCAVLALLGDADLRASLIAKGFQNVEKYRPEAIAAQYAAIYRQFLK